MSPFFRPRGFRRGGRRRDSEKIVIGLYSLKDENGRDAGARLARAGLQRSIMIPCPGDAAYDSPSGEIRGEMTLKRQYRMENGQSEVLRGYAARTSMTRMLLDILSGATSRHMQPGRFHHSGGAERRHPRRERSGDVRGGRRRAAAKPAWPCTARLILMYRRRDLLERLAAFRFLSPGSAFSEYISTVFAGIWARRTSRARTHAGNRGKAFWKARWNRRCEQLETRLLDEEGGELRRQSVAIYQRQEVSGRAATSMSKASPPLARISPTSGWMASC